MDPNFSGYPINICLGVLRSWNDVANWSLGQIPAICDNEIVADNIIFRFLGGEYGECYTIEIQLGAIFDIQIGAEFHAV